MMCTVRLEPDSPRLRPHNLHETYQLPSVQLITPDDGHRRCPKHVEFRDKILDTWCILLVIYTKIITMHGHLNIKAKLLLFLINLQIIKTYEEQM